MSPPDWNAKYAAASGPLYGTQPNAYLRAALARADAPRGRALMLADGDGRNGRYLAALGCAVTAVDLSPVATERALRWDAMERVSVARQVIDLAAWAPALGDAYALVGLFYLHCERDLRQAAVARAVAHLVPGGWFIAEGFATGQAARAGMGPGDPALLYSPETLVPSGLEIVEALEGLVHLEEGQGHRGLAMVARVIARAPG